MGDYDNPAIIDMLQGKLKYLNTKDLLASVALQLLPLTNNYVGNMIGGCMIATMLKVSKSRQLKKRLDHLLPPVANFTIGGAMVRNADVLADAAPFKTYSSFEAMLQVYRDANGGECEINAFAYGKPNRTSCGARTGCHVCTMVNTDTSLENMLQEYPFLKPLLDIRAWILENHYDPASRRWLGREPDSNGDLSIEPNAYSPVFCRQLLRFYLTAQVDELEAAERDGRAPAAD